MIRLTCPSCDKKLNAKPETAGQMRKCPNCGQPIRIPVEEAVAAPVEEAVAAPVEEAVAAPVEEAVAAPAAVVPGDAAASAEVIAISEEHLPFFHRPERLNRESYYLICNRTSLVATWENNGNGWMLKTVSGFIPAKRNRDQLPNQGEFQLIELKFATLPQGRRLTGLNFYQLAARWALNSLDQGDDPVLERIAGPGRLNKDQKNVVRQTLRDHFMRPLWQDAAAVLEYLGNDDHQSHSVGQN
jgi:hypothetical protein